MLRCDELLGLVHKMDMQPPGMLSVRQNGGQARDELARDIAFEACEADSLEEDEPRAGPERSGSVTLRLLLVLVGDCVRLVRPRPFPCALPRIRLDCLDCFDCFEETDAASDCFELRDPNELAL